MDKKEKFIRLAKKLRQSCNHNKTNNRRTSEKQLEIDVTWEEIYVVLEEQDFKCAFTGIPLEPGYGQSGHLIYEAYHPLAPSLDRIDNDIGYHMDNVRIILRFINLGLGGYKGDELSVLKTLGLVP